MCPDHSVLHDLVDDELTPQEREQVLSHVRECPECLRIVQELVTLAAYLHARPILEACPAPGVLREFAEGQFSDRDADSRVRSHVESCLACAELVRILAQPAHSGDEVEFGTLTPRQRARAVTEDCVRVLLPDTPSVVELVWERVLTFVESVKSPDGNQASTQRVTEQFVGALGFRGALDPTLVSGYIIMSTVVLTMDEFCLGQIKLSQVKEFARQTAHQLGAGSELSARLSELMESCLSKG